MIKEKNGIHIDSEEKVVADGKAASGGINFVSHAHFDHLTPRKGRLVCSEETRKIAEERTGEKFESDESEILETIDAGHIIGSKSALIKGNEKVLYTGDFCPRERLFLEGFEPVEADILVIESTYGTPNYVFPEYSEVEKQIIDWIQDNEQPLFLFGYSLGKAQKIQKIVEKATDRPILAHGSVMNMNKAVESVSDIEFDAVPYGENKQKMKENGILVAPTNFARQDSLNKLVKNVNGTKAGFSGWGVQESYKYRGGYDRVFPLSDHADFRELVATVEAVDPEKVYTTHGFDEALASFLSKEKGFNARALKKNQSSLSDFS